LLQSKVYENSEIEEINFMISLGRNSDIFNYNVICKEPWKLIEGHWFYSGAHIVPEIMHGGAPDMKL
jgi:hypothetical protein